MKKLINNLMQNQLFTTLTKGVFVYALMIVIVITVFQVPSEALLDSDLVQVLGVFEEFPDDAVE